jgi:hypothetical protein
MLLTKAELNLAKLASKGSSRYALQGICVQPKHTVVTDGHILVAVTHSSAKDTDYPVTTGLEHKELAAGEVLISAESAAAAAKAIPKKGVPICQNAAIGNDGRLYVNDLTNSVSYGSHMEGKFPNWDMVIPKGKPKAEIALNAELLESLLAYIRQNGDKVPTVRLTVYDAQTAVRIDGKTADGQEVVALCMPMRMDKLTFAQRPHEVKEAAKAEQEATTAA